MHNTKKFMQLKQKMHLSVVHKNIQYTVGKITSHIASYNTKTYESILWNVKRLDVSLISENKVKHLSFMTASFNYFHDVIGQILNVVSCYN